LLKEYLTALNVFLLRGPAYICLVTSIQIIPPYYNIRLPDQDDSHLAWWSSASLKLKSNFDCNPAENVNYFLLYRVDLTKKMMEEADDLIDRTNHLLSDNEAYAAW